MTQAAGNSLEVKLIQHTFLNDMKCLLLNRILDKFYFQKWEMVLSKDPLSTEYTRKALKGSEINDQ